MGFLLNTIKESGGIDVFHILVERTVQPVCTGRLIDPNADVEKEKGTEMQETQDAVQDTLQNTAQDAVQDTPQKAVHKFVGDAAQKIVQNIVGGAVQKTVQNIVEDIVQNTEDTEQNTVENTTEKNTQVSSLTAAQNALADNTHNKEGEHVSGWKSC